MKALTLWQPWASLCVIPRQVPMSIDEVPGAALNDGAFACSSFTKPGPPFKTIETRGWPAPKSLIGQRIAIHAAKKMPPSHLRLGESGIRVQGFGRTGLALVGPGLPEFRSTPRLEGLILPFGKVVGTAVLADCIPVVNNCGTNLEAAEHICHAGAGWLLHHRPHPGPSFDDGHFEREVTDQLPFGDFTPGRWAWLLAAVERFDEPVPARGGQRIWNWEPSKDEQQ